MICPARRHVKLRLSQFRRIRLPSGIDLLGTGTRDPVLAAVVVAAVLQSLHSAKYSS
jgi:hypothetical protein